MTFLNPLLLLGTLGISLPILAHLLNRYQVKRTPWAAMQFLNRSVRVRSRQLRLKDLLLLLLRCLALALLILAFALPVMEGFGGAVGESRAGAVIALDASYSMQHQAEGPSRYEQAVNKVNQIASTIRPGDPVTLCMLGAKPRVVARNVAFDPDSFAQLLQAQQPTFESLNLNGVPQQLQALAAEMKVPQKEIYLVTDMQEEAWGGDTAWLNDALKTMTEDASVFIVPVQGSAENLAVTKLELVSGVLRQGTAARYRATVKNYGTSVARNVAVTGKVNNITMDKAVIPTIEPGASETVSLFVQFRDTGPVRITAEIEADGLAADNARHAVAVVRERVSVLCVEGSSQDSGSAANLIAEALRARGNQEQADDLQVQTVSWVDLPSQDLKTFDVVVLANVPEITPEQARIFEQYVRNGNGLIWFGGDEVNASVWNERSNAGSSPLLPATIQQTLSTSDAMGIGQPLDPSMPDHAVSRPLQSLPEDLLSEARFRKVLQLSKAPTSTTVLTLAGSDVPLLVEQSLGRGHVFMFSTSAGSAWNNMAVTPVFPMLLQQMVTYLTGREFETPRQVGDPLLLSYVDQPNATDAVFDAPSGESVTVPVREFRNQYVAVLDQAQEAGFYQARANLHAEASPIAVNVDTSESVVKTLPVADAILKLRDTGVNVTATDVELLAAIDNARREVSLWRFLLVAGLVSLIVESLYADRLFKKTASPAHGNAEHGEAAG